MGPSFARRTRIMVWTDSPPSLELTGSGMALGKDRWHVSGCGCGIANLSGQTLAKYVDYSSKGCGVFTLGIDDLCWLITILHSTYLGLTAVLRFVIWDVI